MKYFLIALSWSLWGMACSPSSADRTEGEHAEVDTIVPQGYFTDNFPTTAAYLTNGEQFDRYAWNLDHPGKIDGPEQLRALLAIRKQLYHALQKELEEHNITQNFDSLIAEMNTLGLTPVVAEGIVISAALFPFVTSKVEELLTEEEKLVLEFQYAKGESLGSEYTYDDVFPEGKMVGIYEQLQNKFPDSPWVDSLEQDFNQALIALFDVHKLIVTGREAIYINFALETDFYPTATSLRGRDSFLMAYPATRYSVALKKVLTDMSEIANDNDTVYAIVHSWHNSYERAIDRMKILLKSGKDFPHIMEVIRNDHTKRWALIYRFTPNKDWASGWLEQARRMENIDGMFPLTKAAYYQAQEIKLTSP